MNETMLTALYCIIDDFINALAATAHGRKMLELWKAKRGPQRQLGLSEVLTLNILRFHFHIFDLKAFVRLAQSAYKTYFPSLPNYENFLKGDKPVVSVHGITGAVFFIRACSHKVKV